MEVVSGGLSFVMLLSTTFGASGPRLSHLSPCRCPTQATPGEAAVGCLAHTRCFGPCCCAIAPAQKMARTDERGFVLKEVRSSFLAIAAAWPPQAPTTTLIMRMRQGPGAQTSWLGHTLAWRFDAELLLPYACLAAGWQLRPVRAPSLLPARPAQRHPRALLEKGKEAAPCSSASDCWAYDHCL